MWESERDHAGKERWDRVVRREGSEIERVIREGEEGVREGEREGSE